MKLLEQLARVCLLHGDVIVFHWTCEYYRSQVRFPVGPLLYSIGRLSLAASLNRVPASAGVKAGMSPLPGGR